ncbi:MAG TPA: tetratricopeptide repeat protein [Rhizomicrobium sp.]|nr:tetratricopeptide repeat protein [Rhizomicrobium sp.]
MKRAFAILGVLLAIAIAPPVRAQSATALAGMRAYNAGDIATAYRLLRAAADAGDSEGQVNLGYMYARGQGVAADQQEAFRLYQLSADQGDSEGMNALGYKFLHGTGVAADPVRAVHWFCMAVSNGNPRGMNNLAIMLQNGNYVQRDEAEARSLWKQAADLGHASAMMNLGLSYLTGSGRDPATAQQWIVRAAQKGQPRALALLQANGYSGPLPAPFDEAALMIPAVKNASGRAKICGLVA